MKTCSPHFRLLLTSGRHIILRSSSKNFISDCWYKLIRKFRLLRMRNGIIRAYSMLSIWTGHKGQSYALFRSTQVSTVRGQCHLFVGVSFNFLQKQNVNKWFDINAGFFLVRFLLCFVLRVFGCSILLIMSHLLSVHSRIIGNHQL